MNCVNCGSRLTFFNETDELWGGTERALCYTCRKKMTPFLEEACSGSHIDHLHERKAALIARGVTAEGYAHLDEYCRYLDGLRDRKAAPPPLSDGKTTEAPSPAEERVSTLTAIRRSLREDAPADREDAARRNQAMLEAQLQSNQELHRELEELGTTVGEHTRLLSNKLERAQERIRLLTYLAASGAGAGVLSFLSVLLLLILK